MISRRGWLRVTAGAGAALGLNARVLPALQDGPVRTKPIPSSGEQIPVIGLGGRWISVNSSPEELAGHRDVLRALAEGAEGAGRLFDSAAGYGGGGSEEYAGRWAQEDGYADEIFWATKVNVAGRGGGSAAAADVRAQIERSFRRLRVDVIDLDQVHNMGDPPTQLGILQEYKESGRIRYIGITTTSEGQYEDLAQVMRRYPIDFIGIDYAIDNRTAERLVLPLARDEGIGVLAYLPFGRSRMWARIGERQLPEWAAEFDAHTWAQFMLKFVGRPSGHHGGVPGHRRSRAHGGQLGRRERPTPGSEEQLERMTRLVDDLPAA